MGKSETKELEGLGHECRKRPGESSRAWRDRKNKTTEKFFRSHRDTPTGRNFVYWNGVETAQDRQNYRDNFDSIFPNAPGAGM